MANAYSCDYQKFLQNTVIVIQGPISSTGRTSKTSNITLQNLNLKDAIKFDCSDSLNKNVKSYKKIFGGVVISTWANEDTSYLEADIIKNNLIMLEDITPKKAAINQHTHKLGVNKFRQFYSLSQGLLFFNELSPKYTIKLRTDQTIDINALSKFVYSKLCSEIKPHPRSLIVPCFKKGMGFGLEDFYLASGFESMKRFCDLMIGFGYNEFSRSVHCDAFGKLALDVLGPKLDIPIYNYFLKNSWDPMLPAQKKISHLMWSEVLHPAPKVVWETATWRGERLGVNPRNVYSDDFSCKEFAFISNQTQSTKRASIVYFVIRRLANLFYIDWENVILFVFGKKVNRLIGPFLKVLSPRWRS